MEVPRGPIRKIIWTLVIALVAALLPPPNALAAPIPKPKKEVYQEVGPNLANAREVISKRTQYSNSYEDAKGAGYTVIRLDSQNYLKNGKYNQISNKLVSASYLGYLNVNQSNRLKAYFNNSDKAKISRLEFNNYFVEVSLGQGQYQSTQIKDNSIIYQSISPNIDLRYDSDYDGVRKYIVINEKPTVEALDFRLNFSENLKLTQLPNKDYQLVDRSSNQAIWAIERPFALSFASDDRSYGYYEVENLSTASVKLTLPLLKKYFPPEEVGYPVVIDPNIYLQGDSNTASNIVLSGDPTIAYQNQTELPVGMTYNLGIARSYLKFDISSLPAANSIDAAYFGITNQYENVSIPRIKLHRINSSWSNSTLTWNNQPSIGAVEATMTNNVTYSWWNFDVTQLVKDWKNGILENNGFALLAHDENQDRFKFLSRFSNNIVEYRPYLIVYYNSNTPIKTLGQKDGYQYASVSTALGALNANIADGNLFFGFNDITNQGVGFDTIINHSYNSRDNYDGAFGYNWRITPDRKLLISGDRRSIRYIDESGEAYDFYDANGDNNYVSDPKDWSSGFYIRPEHRPPGLFWGLKYDPTSQTYVATSNNKVKYRFASDGRLLEERDRNDNTLTYVYTGSLLTKIVDASGREVKLFYNGSGRLERIQDHNYNDPQYKDKGGKVTYAYTGNLLTSVSFYTGDTLLGTTQLEYTNNRLTQITDANNNISRVVYDGQGRVSDLYDADNKRTQIIYAQTGAIGISKVVSPKGFEQGEDPAKYTTDYYFFGNPIIKSGVVYAQVSPPVKDQNGNERRNTTYYDYNDDYLIHAVVDPNNNVDAYAYDDISGYLFYSYDQNGVFARNTYSRGTYDDGNWLMLDAYDGKNTQTVYYYDERGNLIRKTVWDGESIGYLLNGSFEVASRDSDNNFDLNCVITGFDWRVFNKVGVADTWCGSGSSAKDRRMYAIDKTQYTDGIASQMIGTQNSQAGKSINILQRSSMVLPLEPSTTYTLSWRYKQENTSLTTVQIAVEHANYPNDSLGIVYGDNLESTSWADGVMSFTTPSAAQGYYRTYVYIRIKADVNGATSWAWFDEARLVKGPTKLLFNDKSTSFTYNSRGNPITETTPEGKTNEYQWDNNGNLLQTKDPNGNIATFTYDANGNRLTKTEPKGNQTPSDPNDFKTVFEYDGRNRLTKVIEASTNNTTSYRYDAVGNLIETVTPNGLKTTYTYDKLNRPKDTINPYGFVSKVRYDANGNPQTIIDPNNRTSASKYDGADRLIQETDPNNKKTDYKYDTLDQVRRIEEAGKNLDYNYDKAGQLLSETNNQMGSNRTVSYTYDRNGNITITNSQTGEVINHSYSLTDEITRVTVGGLTTTYTRNKNNQLTRLDRPNGDYVTVGYNNNAQVTSFANSRGANNIISYQFEYDGNGNRTKIITNKPGEAPYTTQYEYDNLNQLKKIITPILTTTYTYDKGGNITRIDRTDNTWEQLSYLGNRLIKKALSSGSVEYYGYDANGNITSRDTGDRINAFFNLNGNLTNSRDNQSAKVGGLPDGQNPAYVDGKFNQALDLSANTYLTTTAASNISYDEGTVELWFKSAWGASDNQKRVFFNYYLDDNNVLRLQKNTDNTLELIYRVNGTDYGTKNNIQRVRFSEEVWQHLAFVYKSTGIYLYFNGIAVGRRTAQVPALPFSRGGTLEVGAALQGETASDYAQGAFDAIRISLFAKTKTEVGAAYNENSEFTPTKITKYEYDSNDYLTKVTRNDGGVANYTYDVNKRLVKRSVTGAADINYQYNGDKITAELNNDNSVAAKYIYDENGQLLYLQRGGANYYPVFDSLGGVIYLRDASGNNVNSYTYDEWGRILTKTEGVYNPIRYASYWYDDYTNLYHLGARWYDPTLYRFISVDPHPGDQDDSLSLNEYLYTANNPIIRTDPKGDKWNPIDKLANWMYQQGYGDAALYLYDNNKYWRFAMDHLYLTGAIVGITAGLTAFGGGILVKVGLRQIAIKKLPKNFLKCSKKQNLKSIRTLSKRIAEHLEKIKRNPRSRDITHWKKEIKEWQKTIRNLKWLLGI